VSLSIYEIFFKIAPSLLSYTLVTKLALAPISGSMLFYFIWISLFKDYDPLDAY